MTPPGNAATVFLICSIEGMKPPSMRRCRLATTTRSRRAAMLALTSTLTHSRLLSQLTLMTDAAQLSLNRTQSARREEIHLVPPPLAISTGIRSRIAHTLSRGKPPGFRRAHKSEMTTPSIRTRGSRPDPTRAASDGARFNRLPCC